MAEVSLHLAYRSLHDSTFLLHTVQRDEETLVVDCQQYCLEHLVARLYNVEPEHGSLAAQEPVAGRVTVPGVGPRRSTS